MHQMILITQVRAGAKIGFSRLEIRLFAHLAMMFFDDWKNDILFVEIYLLPGQVT